jgi:hypothetical protein
MKLQLLSFLWKAVLRRDNFESIMTIQIPGSLDLHGCKTWSLTLREELRLRLLENRVLRKIFGSERYKVRRDCRIVNNEEFYDLYSSPNVIRISKSRRMRWDGHVARMGAEEVLTGFWLGDLSERGHLEDLGVEGRVVLEWIIS